MMVGKQYNFYCHYYFICESYVHKLLKCLFSSNIEEYNSKVLGKLAKQAGSGCVQGTFAPVWQALRTTAEKLSSLHMQMVQKISDLVKEVTKYAEELHKKHKSVSLFFSTVNSRSSAVVKFFLTNVRKNGSAQVSVNDIGPSRFYLVKPIY